MTGIKNGLGSAMQQRINAEIQDNLDEDLELELEDTDLADLLADGHELPEKLAFPRTFISRSFCACSASSSSCRTGLSPRS